MARRFPPTVSIKLDRLPFAARDILREVIICSDFSYGSISTLPLSNLSLESSEQDATVASKYIKRKFGSLESFFENKEILSSNEKCDGFSRLRNLLALGRVLFRGPFMFRLLFALRKGATHVF